MKKAFLFLNFIVLVNAASGQRYNDTLAKQLEGILADDQRDREQLDYYENKYGYNAIEYRAISKKITTTDSVNQEKIKVILDRYGWPGADVIGDDGATALWSVIQHSDIPMMEKYLPLIKKAVNENNLTPGRLAYLEDRMAIYRGKKQVYGSQLGNTKNSETFVLPLEDPANVDVRRHAVGLGPMAEYLAMMNMKWDVEQYIKDLPAIEEKTWTIPYCTNEFARSPGKILFDELYDAPAFKATDTLKILMDEKANFNGGKNAILRYFKDAYRTDIKDANGYVTVFFLVNSEGRAGKFRVHEVDQNNMPLKFDKNVSFQLIYLTMRFKGWEPVIHEGVYYGYYCRLNFKIVNGEINDIEL